MTPDTDIEKLIILIRSLLYGSPECNLLHDAPKRAEMAEVLRRTIARLKERDGVIISNEMLNFLHGCGPLDGYQFGEKPPTERGQFWWRKRLPPRSLK